MNTDFRGIRNVGALSLGLLAAGCYAPTPGPSYGQPPTARLDLAFTGGVDGAKGALRTATLWRTDRGPAESPNTPFIVGPGSQWVGDSALSLDGFVPEAAVYRSELVSDKPSGMAIGTVVVYADDNGSGSLELDGGDRIVGAAKDISLLYFWPSTYDQHGVESGRTLNPGYNLLWETTRPPPIGCTTCSAAFVDLRPIFVNSLMTIQLGAPVHLPNAMCLGEKTGTEEYNFPANSCANADRCPAGRIPQASSVECAVDRRSYLLKICDPGGGLCGETFCQYGWGVLAPGNPAPADWPCP